MANDIQGDEGVGVPRPSGADMSDNRKWLFVVESADGDVIAAFPYQGGDNAPQAIELPFFTVEKSPVADKSGRHAVTRTVHRFQFDRHLAAILDADGNSPYADLQRGGYGIAVFRRPVGEQLHAGAGQPAAGSNESVDPVIGGDVNPVRATSPQGDGDDGSATPDRVDAGPDSSASRWADDGGRGGHSDGAEQPPVSGVRHNGQVAEPRFNPLGTPKGIRYLWGQ